MVNLNYSYSSRHSKQCSLSSPKGTHSILFITKLYSIMNLCWTRNPKLRRNGTLNVWHILVVRPFSRSVLDGPAFTNQSQITLSLSHLHSNTVLASLLYLTLLHIHPLNDTSISRWYTLDGRKWEVVRTGRPSRYGHDLHVYHIQPCRTLNYSRRHPANGNSRRDWWTHNFIYISS